MKKEDFKEIAYPIAIVCFLVSFVLPDNLGGFVKGLSTVLICFRYGYYDK